MSSYKSGELERLWQVELDLYSTLEKVCEEQGLRFFAGWGTALGAVRHQGFIPWDDDMDFVMPRDDYEKLIKLPDSAFGDVYSLLEPRRTNGYVLPFAKLTRADSTFTEETDQDRTYHSGIFIDIFPLDHTWPDRERRLKQWQKAWVWARLCVLVDYPEPKLPSHLQGWKKRLVKIGCRCMHALLHLTGQTKEKLYARQRRAAMSVSAKDAEGCLYDGSAFRYVNGYEDLVLREEEVLPAVKRPFADREVYLPAKPERYLELCFGDFRTLPPEEDRHYHAPSELVFPKEYRQDTE